LKKKSGISLPDGLRHIAIIMDGNGRWAKGKLKRRIFGHRQGADTVDRIVTACAGIGLQALTLYAFSSENWSRPAAEVNALMSLFKDFMLKQRDKLMENKIVFNVIGELERLPDDVKKMACNLMRETSNNGGMVLSLAVSYGSRQEIVNAVKNICTDVMSSKLDVKQISPELISNYLWTKGLPDPDLLIRTSGEMRISNFLLWQIAYTEIYITDVLWPEFDESELDKALMSYAKRERRYGKVNK
jgi:undecaprenyl diphosphate synthase